MSQDRPLPFEDIASRNPVETERPGFLVDLRRCIGCHACSVACKTAHETPLGEFPMRVRWLPRPDVPTYRFVPVFSESLCQDDSESTGAGLDPACVRACPTNALIFGDLAKPSDPVTQAANRPEARALAGPEATDLKADVLYLGLEDWISDSIHRGAELDPADPDPIYEQD